mgnify:CR=1 FL=1
MKCVILLICLSCLFGCKTTAPSSVILNKKTDDLALIEAVKRLKGNTESPNFWIKITQNAQYRANHRRLAVFQLFVRHFQQGMTLAELTELLDCPNWLEDDQIEIVETLAGGVPLLTKLDETLALIKLCPDARMQSAPVIYLRINGKIDRETLSKFIRCDQRDGRAKNLQVLEIASVEYHVKGYPVSNAWGLDPDTIKCE